MVRLLIGVVASRIVTADHGPPGLIGGVFSRGMEKIAVEEEHIAGIHLDVDKRETLEDSGDAFLVGAGLISRQYVVDSSEQMRTLDDLKAAVFASGWIDSNGCAAEIGCNPILARFLLAKSPIRALTVLKFRFMR
jgi:hypothetical protein